MKKKLLFEPTGLISFKLNFDDKNKVLPTISKDIDFVQVSFKSLFNERIKITKDKHADLQSMKPALHKDTWYYYDNIPHKDDSIRAQK